LFFLSLGLAACSKDEDIDSGNVIVDQDSDGVAEGEDCDDLDAALGSQLEDADCDGTLTEEDCDDADPALNEADVDADGTSTCAGDCNDEDPSVHPAAVEVCNGVDDDCDGLLDSDDDSVDTTDLPDWYRDADQDGYGSEEDSLTQCDQPAWYVLEQSEGFDCDDSDPEAYPGATEYCDGHDDNCDGEIDEDSAADVLTWYSDSDGDGFGDLTNTDIDCYEPSGYVADSTDCNDSNDNAYPGNDEICDGVDNDCLGDIDEDDALDVLTWYADTDTDTYGDPAVTDVDCYQPSGYVADNTDCDDGEATTYPGADEYCDGVNNDCDTETDEDHALDATTWYADTDGDGYGDPAVTDVECYQPSGYVADNTDCDDGDATLSNQDYTLDASSDTWTNVSVSYCDVVLKNGAILYVSGLVELDAYGSFSVDATSEINGDGAGEAAASGSGAGGYSSSAGGGGAGYGGAGGRGGFDSSDSPGAGGSAYGSSTSESIAVGSGGGNTDYTTGGAGGAAIAIWSDSISISGLISMNGVTGGGGQGRNGGGGSGGGILLVGNTVSISGDLEALAGNGGSGTSSANDGGGGGGGGRIKVFYDSSLSYSGSYDVSGGTGGTYGSAAHGASGTAGTETETSQAYP